MGYNAARDMAAHAKLETALHWHLTANHYPPHPAFMVGPAVRAVRNARRGDYDKRVRLPRGVEHRTYGRLVPTHAMVESLHLEAFID